MRIVSGDFHCADLQKAPSGFQSTPLLMILDDDMDLSLSLEISETAEC